MRFNILFFFICISSTLFGQNFFRSYGNTNDELGRSAVEAKDSSFMIIGTSSSFIDGTSNFYLLHIDTLGNFLWSKTYGGNSVEQGYDLVLKPNGHFLLTGYSNSFGNGYEAYVVEVDSLGNEVWTKNYGGTDWDFAYNCLAFPNGDVLITGNTYSFGNGNSDGFHLMINNVGDSLWWKNYGTSREEVLRRSMITSNGEILSVGYNVTSFGDKDFYVVKCKSDGDTIWTKSYGFPEDDEGFALAETATGNYLFGGYSKGIAIGNEEFYYFETDTSGNVIWTQNFGGSGIECIRDMTVKPGESRFITAGVTGTYGNGGREAISSKLTIPGGYLNGGNNYGTINQEEFSGVLYTSHQRILLVGMTNNPYLNEDVMIVLTDTLFPTQSTMTPYEDVTSIPEEYFTNNILFYPNPAHNVLFLNEELKIEEIFIYNLTGQLLLQNIPIENKVNISSLSEGVYLVQLKTEKGIACQKLIILSR